MSVALEHLCGADSVEAGRVLVVTGDSGTGKTFFAGEVLARAQALRSEDLYLYLDVSNDEFQSARTIASLLQLALIPGVMTPGSPVSVPVEISLDRMRSRTQRRGFGRGLIRALVGSIGVLVGAGSAVGSAIGEPTADQDVESELASYLKWVTRKHRAVLTIDNVQFLNTNDRLALESIVQWIGGGMRMVVLDRTINGQSELTTPVRCLADSQLRIELDAFSATQTEEIVTSALGTNAKNSALARDIFTKTGGIAKEIEYCLRQYSIELESGSSSSGSVEGLLSTIDRLPLIYRGFLVVASMLEGGVKAPIAANTVRRLVSPSDESALDAVLEELVARDYLRVGSDTGDRLRPGHERVVTAIRDLADFDLQEEVRLSLVEEISASIDSPTSDENESYLLHCLVGLQTAHELSRNVHYISRLIQSQHRQEQFSYLAVLSDEIREVVPLLPDHAMYDLLDALQKNSSFERGLEIVQSLDAAGIPGADDRRMHRFKFLAQAYRYEEALAISETLPSNDWSAVYRVNALMSLDRFDEAQALLASSLAPQLSEPQAVLRRNTITLLDHKTALRHLDEAHDFFARSGSEFRLATVETNRSVVHLHAGQLGDAGKALESAEARMRSIGSREIYQAQINLALKAALQRDYDRAVDLLETSAFNVPRLLTLDLAKIAMNRAIIEFSSGTTRPADLTTSLQQCQSDIRGIEMPYMQRALEYNLAAAAGASLPIDDWDLDAVSISLPIPTNGRLPAPYLMAKMSIHWRY